MSFPCVSRIHLVVTSLLSVIVLSGLAGCASKFNRPELANLQAPLSAAAKAKKEKGVRLVGDLAKPWGLKNVRAEGVSLAVNLPGTGSDPSPSVERSMLTTEMQRHDVHKPDSVLASSNTALCMIQAVIPPGAQKGDLIDVEVRVPAKSKTISLENGWLMQARLKEFAKLNNRLATGRELALSKGEILVDSVVEGTDDPVMMTRGRILGGGIVTETREMGLRIRQDQLSAKTSHLIGVAINQRFHIYSNGNKTGVANPTTDKYVELVVHPRYRSNLTRYIRVIEAVPVREDAAGLVSRLGTLRTRLMDRANSSRAAVQLEAIGSDAVPVLLEGLRSPDPEVSFYSAEALAYLDHADAAATLSETIRRHPAFRRRAFLALEAMQKMQAIEELSALLSDDSIETRYAAFRALRKSSPDDPLVRGERMASRFWLHQITGGNSPVVHIAKEERSEIVLFGDSFPLSSPVVLFGGPRITVRDTVDGRIKIKHLSSSGDNDQQLVVDADLESVIRGVSQLGGKYTDIVKIISQAKANGCLKCRVAYSALPKDGRKFDRNEDWNLEEQNENGGLGAPGFAAKRTSNSENPKPVSSRDDASRADEPQNQRPAPVIDSVGFDPRRVPANTQSLDQVSVADFNGNASSASVPVSEGIRATGELEIIGADELENGFLLDDRTPLPTGTTLDMAESATLIEPF